MEEIKVSLSLQKLFIGAVLSFCLICCLTSCYKDPDPVEQTPVNLSETETANCYIASVAGQLYEFRADVMGNGLIPTPNPDEPDNVSLDVPSNAVAAILWMTPHDRQVIYAPYYNSEYKTISFYTSAYSGNAVIGLFVDTNNNGVWDSDGSEKIIWSWHIWCVDYDPSVAGNYEVYYQSPLIGTKVMNRNLGAYLNVPSDLLEENIIASFGLKYQFGRKDPFPTTGVLQGSGTLGAINLHNRGLTYPDNVWKETSQPADVSLDYATNHPTTFIFSYELDEIWLAGDNSCSLWGVQSEGAGMNRKTIYDPCPPGWRVPAEKVFAPLATDAGSSLIVGVDKMSSQYGVYLNYGGADYTFLPADGFGLINESKYTIAGVGQEVSLGTGSAFIVDGMLFSKYLSIEAGGTYIASTPMIAATSIRCVADE